ncbi:MAG: hypothetical protein NW218_11030 [Saprospiraceae bacterium]|jgi:hypothetical protein|nr:hypothetical protein [Saprospiraceae bacterium]
MTVTQAFDDIAEILAQLDPQKIAELHAAPELSSRVEELVNKKKEALITPDESIELERYLALDMLINMAKARARRLLAA